MQIEHHLSVEEATVYTDKIFTGTFKSQSLVQDMAELNGLANDKALSVRNERRHCKAR